MSTIQQTIQIPDNRRLQLDLVVPDDMPVGTAEMTVDLAPTSEGQSSKTIQDFAGCLANSKTFAGNSVEIQRAMRDEW